MPGQPSEPRDRNLTLYDDVYDVLRRQPVVDDVRFVPDAVQKRHLEATVHPEWLSPPTGPKSPTITVKWDTSVPYDWFRVDYADPNIDFHCGWHYDRTHQELGDVHFQYQRSGMEEPERESAGFDFESPVRILWECLRRLFDDVLPSYANVDT